MNISKINTYNQAQFGAKKITHSYNGKHVKPSKAPSAGKVAGGVVLGTAAALAMLVPSCQSNKPVEVTTEPTAIYGETFATEATQATETVPYETPAPVNMINSIPMEEREHEEYHTVKAGDRLTDIVIKYAELDEDYPYEKLIPYFNRLQAENPGLIDDKYNVILIPGRSLRVDGIMPENIIKGSTVITTKPDEGTEPTEIKETEPDQTTSDRDTVYINETKFCFDLGTIDKKMFGDYEGLMFGKFAKLDKKMNGNVELTKYEGTTADSNKDLKFVYDKDGKIIEMVNYENNQAVTTSTYTYKMDCMIETITDNSAKTGLINVVTTNYDNNDDIINSREFFVDGQTVAKFDFNTDTIVIGETTLTFDANTFECDDDAIGSRRYTGIANGQVVRIDALKNGFCIEYLGNNGRIETRQQFDAKGNLIYTE